MGRLPCEAAVGTVIVVVVLPLLQFVVEQPGVVDDDAVEEAVELLDVDAVGALDLAVEPGRGRFDVGVADALVDHVPVERRLEFGPVTHCLDSAEPLVGGVGRGREQGSTARRRMWRFMNDKAAPPPWSSSQACEGLLPAGNTATLVATHGFAPKQHSLRVPGPSRRSSGEVQSRHAVGKCRRMFEDVPSEVVQHFFAVQQLSQFGVKPWFGLDPWRR